MQVILLEKIHKLGKLGEKVKVKPGYGRNYLLPQGKAVAATANNLKKFEAERAELEKRASESLAEAKMRANQVEALGSVTIAAKVIDDNKLYGSVGVTEISRALTEAGLSITKNEIKLPEGPFRQTGEYDLSIQLHSDLTTTIQLKIIAEA